jgi:hypothetical protein
MVEEEKTIFLYWQKIANSAYNGREQNLTCDSMIVTS